MVRRFDEVKKMYMNNLITETLTLGSGGSTPASHPETRFTLEGGTVESYDITGALDRTWLSNNGFWNNTDYDWDKTITQIDVGNTVTSIGDVAFELCSMGSITIPNSVTIIGDGAFCDCANLTSVTIGNGVTRIGTWAFFGCHSLSLTLGKSTSWVESRYMEENDDWQLPSGSTIICTDGTITVQ